MLLREHYQPSIRLGKLRLFHTLPKMCYLQCEDEELQCAIYLICIDSRRPIPMPALLPRDVRKLFTLIIYSPLFFAIPALFPHFIFRPRSAVAFLLRQLA